MRKNKVIFTAMILAAALLLPIKVKASEKLINVNIEQDYAACTFMIEAFEPGDYEINLIDSEGNVYNCVQVKEQLYSCTVEKVKIGAWTVQVNSSLEEIGQFKVSVGSAREGESYVPGQTIAVGYNIADLKYYFFDRTLVVEWGDSSVGEVSVKVVNLSNNEILSSGSTSATSYECEIGESVEKVMLSVVPTSSSNISGAEKVFTIDTDVTPDAKVEFDSKKIVNTEATTVHLTLNKDYSYELLADGNIVGEKKALSAGIYDISIPLPNEGINNICLYLIDDKNNHTGYTQSYTRDTSYPKLELSKEYDGITTTDESLLIEGVVTGQDLISINNIKIVPHIDGYFSYEVVLHEGTNSLTINASDEAGNQTVYELLITRVIVEKKETNYGMIVAVFCLVLALAGGIFFMFKKKDDNKPRKLTRGGSEEPEEENLSQEESNEPDIFSDDYVDDEDNMEDQPSDKADGDDEAYYDYKYNSLHDKGTGLLNRRAFDERVASADKEGFCAISIDANNLKVVNDTLGHEAGDKLLKFVADTLCKYFGRDNTFRTGGDEFYIILEGIDTSEIENRLNLARQDFKTKTKEDKEGIKYSVAAGYFIGNESVEKQNVIELADKMMYENKKKVKAAQTVSLADLDLSEGTVVEEDGKKKVSIEKEEKMQKFFKSVLGYGLVMLISFVVFRYVIELNYVVSESMETTLMVHDLVVSNRLAKGNVHRQDIIAFKMDGEMVMKRAIGLGGDIITFMDGDVYVNGQKLDESAYLPEGTITTCTESFTVPEGEIFVLGDNRSVSFDSRFWAYPYVSASTVTAKEMFVVPTHKVIDGTK